MTRAQRYGRLIVIGAILLIVFAGTWLLARPWVGDALAAGIAAGALGIATPVVAPFAAAPQNGANRGPIASRLIDASRGLLETFNDCNLQGGRVLPSDFNVQAVLRPLRHAIDEAKINRFSTESIAAALAVAEQWNKVFELCKSDKAKDVVRRFHESGQAAETHGRLLEALQREPGVGKPSP
jgi:hypothetical protein